ncbi:MAG: hypothetical protein ACXVB1_18435, partial [Pseudobdellovibrionaceae bacterium]
MNSAYLHLIFNHLPMLLPMVGVSILTVGATLKLRESQIVGLVVIVLGALAAVPTYVTGTFAKDVAQNYPLVTAIAVESHEQAALYSFIAIEIVGCLGLILLWWAIKGKIFPRKGLVAMIFLTLFSFFLLIRTAHLGGLIRHEEIERGSF